MSGDNTGAPTLETLAQGVQFKEGEQIVTSGDGGLLPSGLPDRDGYWDGRYFRACCWPMRATSDDVRILDLKRRRNSRPRRRRAICRCPPRACRRSRRLRRARRLPTAPQPATRQPRPPVKPRHPLTSRAAPQKPERRAIIPEIGDPMHDRIGFSIGSAVRGDLMPFACGVLARVIANMPFRFRRPLPPPLLALMPVYFWCLVRPI
jgi:hypothetical protein